MKSFRRSDFPHKSVSPSFNITNIKDELTNSSTYPVMKDGFVWGLNFAKRL